MPVERPVPMEWGSIGKDSRADMDVDLSASDFLHDALARAQQNLRRTQKKPKHSLGLEKGLRVNPRTTHRRLDIPSHGFQRNSFPCVDP